MPRPGGNPGLDKFKFLAAGVESNNSHLQIMISSSMRARIKAIPGWQNWLRGVISAALDDLGD